MPISIRVITILDQKYTVEMEIEEDEWKILRNELMVTSWGRRVLWLINRMLPNIPEEEKNVDSDSEEKTETETDGETSEA